MVQETLTTEHAQWIGGTKADGGRRKDTPMRSVCLDERTDGAPSHGFSRRWAQYEGAWQLLD